MSRNKSRFCYRSALRQPFLATAVCLNFARTNLIIFLRRDSVHLQIRETLSLSLSRDGGLVSLALKGDLNLLLASPDYSASLAVLLSPPASFLKAGGNDIQFKTHPNVDKKAWTDRGEVRLKEGKKFPVAQAVGVLKWRVTGKDESVVPISSKSMHFHRLHVS